MLLYRDWPVRGCHLKQFESSLQPAARSRRAEMRQQIGLISEYRAETDTIAGIVYLQVLGQLGDGHLCLDPQLIPAALDAQWQGVVNVIGHAGGTARRSAGPVPAPHFREIPAQAQSR